MKRTFLATVLAMLGAFVFSQERIAVFPFEDRNNVFGKDQSDSFYRDFTNEFSNRSSGRFTVIPRQDVERLIDMEIDFQLSDYSSRAKTADMQRVLNATQILSGIIVRVDNNIRVTVSRYTFPDLQQLPGGASISAANINQLFGKIPELIQGMLNVIGNTLVIPGGNEDADGLPSWTKIPLNGRAKFETGSAGVSYWYYEVGMSNRTSTEQLARTRARENIQQNVAANIASTMKARIDITSNSMFDLSDNEETQNRIQTTLVNSISTKVPSYEVLEFHIQKGNENGRDWYRVYLLVRFIRQDVLKGVEGINTQSIADSIIRTMRLSATEYERAALISELEGAREFSLEEIRNASGGR